MSRRRRSRPGGAPTPPEPGPTGAPAAPSPPPPAEPAACPVGDPIAGPLPVCPACGYRGPLLWVHGEGRCARCGTVLDTCCSGAPLDGG